MLFLGLPSNTMGELTVVQQLPVTIEASSEGEAWQKMDDLCPGGTMYVRVDRNRQTPVFCTPVFCEVKGTTLDPRKQYHAEK